MIDISKYFSALHVHDITALTKNDALVELWKLVADTPQVTYPDRFLAAVMEREKVMSTGIGTGIAIPHAKTTAVSDFVIAVGRSRNGLDFESLDGQPVNIIVLMGSPERKRTEFLKIIAKIGEVFTQPGFKERFIGAETCDDMYAMLVEKVG